MRGKEETEEIHELFAEWKDRKRKEEEEGWDRTEKVCVENDWRFMGGKGGAL